MGFMAAGGGFRDGDVYHWWYQKQPSFTIQTCSENTNWDTATVRMSVDEEDIRNTTGRVNAALECWGCTKSPIYHVDRLHTYRNCPNKMDPDVADRTKRSI